MLSRTPFVTIAVIFICGILLAPLVPATELSLAILAAIAVGLLIALLILFIKRKMPAFGLAFALFLLTAGLGRKLIRDWELGQQYRLWRQSGCNMYVAEVASLPEKRPKSVRVEATVLGIKSSGKWTSTHFKTLLSFPSSGIHIPPAGIRMLIHGNLKEPDVPDDRWQFDYRRYLRNKGIFATGGIRNGDFRTVAGSTEATVGLWSIRASAWADSVFQKHIVDEETYGLVKAMLLGRRDDLGSELVKDYTVSGAVHILSVSGMHVAIIFLVLSQLLGWVKKMPGGRALFLALITGSLVFYAMITGLPPSVQRATLMCIVFAAADVFDRKNEPLNTLGLSALLVLLWDPASVYDVGFQLSYLAMSGIFLFYKPIEQLVTFNNRIGSYVWQVTDLSFAAQLTTFPLSLYYFHQFPAYFWLANPFVIFFTNILLPAALVMLLCSIIPVAPLQWLVGQVVLWSGKLANYAVALPGMLPGNLVQAVNLSVLEVVILFALLLLVWLAVSNRQYAYLKGAFALIPLFATTGIWNSTLIYLQPVWKVHRVPGHAVISLKKGNTLYLVSDREFQADTNAYQFYLQNYQIALEADRREFIAESSAIEPHIPH